MRFKYLEEAMEYIVVECCGQAWCEKHQAWSGLMVKDSSMLGFLTDRIRKDRFSIVTKCCEKEPEVLNERKES